MCTPFNIHHADKKIVDKSAESNVSYQKISIQPSSGVRPLTLALIERHKGS